MTGAEILDASLKGLTLLVAVAAAVTAFVEYRHKKEIDERSKWWEAAQWAIDKTVAASEQERQVGWFFYPAVMDQVGSRERESELAKSVYEYYWEFGKGKVKSMLKVENSQEVGEDGSHE